MKLALIFAILITTIAAGQVPQQTSLTPVKSDVYAWKNLQVEKREGSERRAILDASGPVMSEIEIHATTLEPKRGPQPKHKHEEEVLVIIKEGILKVTIDDKSQVLG